MSQLDFIRALLQAKVNNRVFVKLDSKYADYFSEYSNYFVRALILLKYMYEMNDSIENQTFLVQDPEKGDRVTPCMNVYKEKSNMMKVLTI